MGSGPSGKLLRKVIPQEIISREGILSVAPNRMVFPQGDPSCSIISRRIASYSIPPIEELALGRQHGGELP